MLINFRGEMMPEKCIACQLEGYEVPAIDKVLVYVFLCPKHLQDYKNHVSKQINKKVKK